MSSGFVDKRGKEIKLGDQVAFAAIAYRRAEIVIGEVTGFPPSLKGPQLGITVRFPDEEVSFYGLPSDRVVKLEG